MSECGVGDKKGEKERTFHPEKKIDRGSGKKGDDGSQRRISGKRRGADNSTARCKNEKKVIIRRRVRRRIPREKGDVGMDALAENIGKRA